jgi:hypothetical protein
MDKKIITFENPKQVDELIEKILADNGLKEDVDDYAEKIDQNIEPYSDILYKSLKSMFGEETSESDFLAKLQKELKITDQIANKILKESKDKISPLVKVLSPHEIEKENTTPISTASNSAKQNIQIQIEKADRLPPMPTAEPIPAIKESVVNTNTPTPETETESQPKPTPTSTRKRDLPKKEEIAPTSEVATGPAPRVQMKKGPDAYREPVE